MFFLSTVINGSSTEQTASVTNSSGGFGLTGILIYFIVLIAIFYFLAIRPQKKREKQLNDLLSTIAVGDFVILDSGFYGKITDINEQVFMIEFGVNKGVIVPIVKQRVVSKVDPNTINS